MAIVLVNAARMVPNNSSISWAGIEAEGGLDLGGKTTLSPCWSVFPSMEGVGAAISSSSGLIFVEGSASFNLVRCMVGDGVSRVMLCDYKVIIRGEGILAGAVGLCNLP